MAQQRVLAKEEYTVGWVCALPLELVAARHMLDEIHTPIQEQDVSDHNSYVLGSVGEHNIVVAGLPSGICGNTPAATVAKDMLRTFPSIRFGLLVGIGGAAPSEENDIRLGDVVVSRPSGKDGGVIQYDRGKVTQKGEESSFVRTGSLNSPPTLLLTSMTNLESLHAGIDTKIPDFIEQMFTKFPKLRKDHKHPGSTHDRLYQPDYVHADPNKTCEACDPQRQVLREPRDEDIPEIYYGSIASSNQVMKNALTRDQLRDELDVLCFEMEAAGLMQDFPCLVIRGICDYADSHKNKRWQKYAAVVAAAYAKEFLGVVPAARVKQEKSIRELTGE